MTLKQQIELTLYGIKNIRSTIFEVVSQNSEVLVELNRSQILQGRDNEGNLFSPGYSNDSYFKTPEKAQRYAAFKERLVSGHNSLIRYPLFMQKPADTPNLIVTGPFIDGLFINISSGEYMINSNYKDANKINDKYGGKVFNLSEPARNFFYENVIYPKLIYELYGMHANI